ncbi:FGGY family carbohydrate kinase [Fulvivirgaceae bacterium BMA12]|uniref:FGGY family carbohydrate kinase n=1 Tax=Agaribacillus aureus TaxID=3051825 RepID=A0ABT8L1X6_9BACT|nr:FGGY family carbohydrate kinase [Fulvivirgaceae bacterium BMA12]
MGISSIGIFDIGKTNKKFIIYDENLNKIHQQQKVFDPVKDDDGDPCEPLDAVVAWIKKNVRETIRQGKFDLKCLNFSTYGATMVHLDATGKPVTPLYNYLKPFPETVLQDFLLKYGGRQENDLQTASPTMGMLNAGLQLYWLKYSKPAVFRKIKYSLHFPQYLSFLFTGKLVSEPTSIGCHTKLWDFEKEDYHQWVYKEGLDALLPEIVDTKHSFAATFLGKRLKVGVGIHDSSSSLLSYLSNAAAPFILLSTGTWNIALNPFNNKPLTIDELNRDCLLFLNTSRKPVKVARAFLGNEFSYQLTSLNRIFEKPAPYYKSIPWVRSRWREICREKKIAFYPATMENDLLLKCLPNDSWDVKKVSDFEEAYYYLMMGLVDIQALSLSLVMHDSQEKKIVINGGFSGNQHFITLLKLKFPGYTFEVSNRPEGSAHGAALIIRDS